MLRRRLFVVAFFGLWVASCDEPGGSSGQADADSSAGDADSAAPPDGTADSDTRPDGTADTDTRPDVTTGTDTAVGDTDVGPTPDWGDDEALLAWLGAVVAQCPPTSLSTAPVLWKMTMITEYGCVVRHPEEWITNLQPGVFTVTADASQHVGYMVVGTYLQGYDWTEVTLGDHLVAELRKTYPDLVVLAADTATDPYGIGVRFRVIIMKFEMDGTRTLGVAKIVHDGCSALLNNCALTASITWAPAAELPTWACTLAQIEATLHCPSGGGDECDENDCDTSCKTEGHDGGTCVGDNCMCY